MSKRLVSVLVVGAFALTASAADISLTRIGTIDFTGQLAGDNVTAVAWDGTNAYAAPYTNTARDVAITAADDALTAPAFRQFGAVGVTAFRGYAGLAIHDGMLASAVCADGNAAGSFFSIWNAADGALLASGTDGAADTNGGGGAPRTGTAWDPIKGGAVTTSFGSGRYRQIDTSGSVLWDQNSGPVNYGGDWGTSWNDTDIDPDGNLYSREGFQIIKFNRTGDDSIDGGTNLTPQFNAVIGDTTFGMNLEVLEDFGALLWNDRSAGADLLQDTVKAMDLDGNPLTIEFTNSATDFTSNGMFDFSYDAASQTLAISEFSSRRVYIYQVVPEPTSLLLLGLGGLALLRRR